ncbi:hypothetical protein O6P39_11510 [Pseudomonas sp. PSE14]|nr:hypothetical protein [Pseudomonas sp. PSE14]WEJ74964.1 hypothetical protein O6P39_11510 [Pseudomonas sp. PSE14]
MRARYAKKRAAEIGYALPSILEVAEAIAHAMAAPGQRQGMCNWKNCENISPGSVSPMRSATSPTAGPSTSASSASTSAARATTSRSKLPHRA